MLGLVKFSSSYIADTFEHKILKFFFRSKIFRILLSNNFEKHFLEFAAARNSKTNPNLT